MVVLATEARKSERRRGNLTRQSGPVPGKRRRLTGQLSILQGHSDDRSETCSLVGYVSGDRSNAEDAKGRGNA